MVDIQNLAVNVYVENCITWLSASLLIPRLRNSGQIKVWFSKEPYPTSLPPQPDFHFLTSVLVF
jgi:hypothetical protein